MRHDLRDSQRSLDWEEALDDLKTIKLDGRLDYSVAEKIYGEFLAALGQPIAIDAGNVTFVGALAHQVLLSAQKTWDAAGISFVVTAASKEFGDCLDTLGSPKGLLDPVQS